MSLVQHIRGGTELSGLITSTFPSLHQYAREADEVARVRAVRPPERQQVAHYAEVGGIVGQRLADLIQPAPPWPSLLGAARCGALSLAEAGRLVKRYPTHRTVPAASTTDESAVFLRPTPTGWWQAREIAAGGPVDGEGRIRGALRAHAELAASLTPGQLESDREERQRIRIYRALNLLESVYRGNDDLTELQLIADTGDVLVTDSLEEDVTAVLRHVSATIDQARELGSGTGGLGYAAPLFVPGWAEGDILVGPDRHGGYTLLDVKTVTSVDKGRAHEWLRQLVAYACCDVTDRWRIRRIGLWLPRQARLMHWPIQPALVADWNEWAQLRHDIAAVTARCAAKDGADPTPLLHRVGS